MGEIVSGHVRQGRTTGPKQKQMTLRVSDGDTVTWYINTVD